MSKRKNQPNPLNIAKQAIAKSIKPRVSLASTQTPAKTIIPAPTSPYAVSTTSMVASMTRIKGPSLPEVPATPVVWINPEAYEVMKHIVDKCPEEVGWMCTVTDLTDNNFLIDQVYLPKQEVTSVETDIDPDALTETYLEIMNSGKDPSTMYAWFHSHVNMACSPSGQDELQVQTFLQTLPILIRGIMNKRGDIKVDVYLRDQGVAFNCVDVEIDYPVLTTARIAELDAEILAKVKKAPLLPGRANGWNPRTGSNSHAYNASHPLYDDGYAAPSFHAGSQEWRMCDDCFESVKASTLTNIPARTTLYGVYNDRGYMARVCPTCISTPDRGIPLDPFDLDDDYEGFSNTIVD